MNSRWLQQAANVGQGILGAETPVGPTHAQLRLLLRDDLMREAGITPPPPLEPAVDGGLFIDVVAPIAVRGLHITSMLSYNISMNVHALLLCGRFGRGACVGV